MDDVECHEVPRGETWCWVTVLARIGLVLVETILEENLGSDVVGQLGDRRY
jgi:hypothetical protein